MYVLSLPTSTITKQSCRLYVSLDTPDYRHPVADSLTLCRYTRFKSDGRRHGNPHPNQHPNQDQKYEFCSTRGDSDTDAGSGSGSRSGTVGLGGKRPIEPPVVYSGAIDALNQPTTHSASYATGTGIRNESLLTNYSDQNVRGVVVTRLPSTSAMRQIYMNQTQPENGNGNGVDIGYMDENEEDMDGGYMDHSHHTPLSQAMDVNTDNYNNMNTTNGMNGSNVTSHGVLLEDSGNGMHNFKYVAIAINIYKYEPLFKYLLCQTPYRCKKNVSVELDLDSSMSELLVVPSTYHDNVMNGLFWLTATLVTLTTGKIYSVPQLMVLPMEEWV